MFYQIVLAPAARRDFKNLKRYISLDSPPAAERFALLLHAKVKMLSLHPEIGRVFPEIGDVAIREIIVKNYRVIYGIDSLNKKIKILRYWHAARGIPEII